MVLILMDGIGLSVNVRQPSFRLYTVPADGDPRVAFVKYAFFMPEYSYLK